MNVLLINPEMPYSFWTLPRLCRLAGRRSLAAPLSLITVAGLLPREWELRLIDLDARKDSDIGWEWADIIMLSGMIPQRQSLNDLISAGKQRGKIVVVGGPYATSLPKEVLEMGCDFLVRGEAESTMPLLLEALQAGKTQGIFEEEAKQDLSTSPVPRFDLLNLEDYDTLVIQTSRGCPYDCEFCDVPVLYGRKPRYKKPHQVIKELNTIYHLGWRRGIFICDDNFIGNKGHARAILNLAIIWLKDHGMPFSFLTQSSVNLGQDMELLHLMIKANFSTVFIGIETPDEDILALTLKHQNLRHPLRDSLKNIQTSGLTVIGSFIIGFDGEKPNSGDRICSFIEATNIPVVMLNILQPLPGTKFHQRLEKEGRLLENRMNESWQNLDSIGGRPLYLTDQPEEQILAEYAKMWDYLYEPSRFLARTYRYFLSMSPSPPTPARSKEELSHSHRSVHLAKTLQDLMSFLLLSWWQGILPSYRWQYWKQLLGILRKNPSRTVKYLQTSAFGEDMFLLRRIVQKG
jgi:radical SAM superfamily enzyme YgiQ (UPF0313 family)